MRWLLAALDRLEVPCVVLHGDRDLPRLPATGALGVAVAPRHAARFELMLARAAERYGVELARREGGGHRRRYTLLGADASGGTHVARIELSTALTCHGVPLLPARELLQGRTRRRGHARPEVVVSAVTDFLGPYLVDGAVRDETLARMATVLEQSPAQTRVLLGQVLGTRMADELTDHLRGAARAKLFRAWRRARNAALGRAFRAAPLDALAGWLAHAWARALGEGPHAEASTDGTADPLAGPFTSLDVEVGPERALRAPNGRKHAA